MYRRCIFCSAALGSNDALEEFPVGRRVAFDAARGRLWAVCPKCGRWNLAPLEERWEAVEAAERLFRAARRRVQSERIGMAALRDGTRLIRVGHALLGELAAWRYGDELVRRRWRVVGHTAGVLALLDLGVLMLIAERAERAEAVLYRAPLTEYPSGTELQVRAKHLRHARLTWRGGDPAAARLDLPSSVTVIHGAGGYPLAQPGPPVSLDGAAARAVLARALVLVNSAGASRGRVRDAVALLEEAGSSEAWLARLAAAGAAEPALAFRPRFGGFSIGRAAGSPSPAPALPRAAALALEMALNEEAERRAMAGELAELERAWRDAEEIAAIADSL